MSLPILKRDEEQQVDPMGSTMMGWSAILMLIGHHRTTDIRFQVISTRSMVDQSPGAARNRAL